MTHTYSMELVIIKKKKNESHKIDYLTQLPNDCLKLIIFCNKPQIIGAIKNTCRRLASLASILNADDDHIHHYIDDETTRSLLFKRVTATDNPQYVQKLFNSCKKEAQLINKIPDDSIVVTIDNTPPQQKRYPEQADLIKLLLQQAVEQNKYNAIYTIINECNQMQITLNKTLLHYAAEKNSDLAIQVLLDNNFDPDAEDSNEDTPLYIALQNDNKSAIAALTLNAQNNATVHSYHCERLALCTCFACCILTIMIGVPTLLVTFI